MCDTSYKAYVKKYFICILLFIYIPIFIFIITFYTIDPLQIFHKSWFQKDMFSRDMREQAAGIINNFDFDSIILGTSMLQNTSAKEASEKIGGTFFNISMSGSDFWERSFVLKKALQKELKNVLYSLDDYYISCQMGYTLHPVEHWIFLYDNNPFNDFKRYATITNIKKLFKKNRGLKKEDIDLPTAWCTAPIATLLFGGLANWIAKKDNPAIKDFLSHLPTNTQKSQQSIRKYTHNFIKEQNAKEYVQKYLVDIIIQHPNTNFYLIFPPYFRYHYAVLRRNSPEDFFLHQSIITYLVNLTKDIPNMHIYGFEDQAFLDDIANYMDTLHYHHKFNSFFLDAIRTGQHELTPQTLKKYLEDCEQKAWDFDIPKLNAEAQRLLQAEEKRP